MKARPDAVLVGALLALTFSTGIIDAVSFLALGQVFTANMTGNVALLGFALFSPELSLPRSLTALGVFLLGAMAGGRLAASAALAPGRRWMVVAFAGEAVLLAACAIAAHGAASPIEARSLAYLFIAVLAFAMGIRNAIVRCIGLRDLPTTVVTSSLADLGMTIAARDGRSPWKRAVASAVLMVVGAGAGALMLRASVSFALAASALIAAVCAGALGVRRRESP
jgi:uncharacterized membrane protein YoaK (UPF0700 family)